MKEILKCETTQKWKPLQFLNIADQIVWFDWVFTPKKIQRKAKKSIVMWRAQPVLNNRLKSFREKENNMFIYR